VAEVTIDVVARDSFSSVLGSFGSIITGIESAINLVSGAFQAATDIIQPFIASAAESELTIAKLDAVIRATGGAAGVTSEQLQNIANDLQGVTRFSDEQILSGTSLMLTFRNISGEVLERAIPAMLDMGEIFGSTDAAAMQLGKALNDPVNMMGALSRAGVTFTDSQKEMIKSMVESGDLMGAQNIILTELEMQVGGVAEAVGGTFTGKWEIARNKLDEVRELIGGPIITALGNLLDSVMEFADNNPILQGFMDFMGRFNELFSGGVPFLEALGITFRTIGEHSDWISSANPAFQELGIVLLDMQRVLDNGGTFMEAFETALGRLAAGDGPLSGIAETIQNFINTGETEGWGTAIANLYDEPIKPALTGMFENLWGDINWQDKIQGLVNNLAVAIDDADWSGVTRTLAEVMSTAISLTFNGLAFIVTDINWAPLGVALQGAMKELIDGWFSAFGINLDYSKFSELSKNIIDGIIRGFTENPIVGPITTVVNGIINTFKRLLGISSPSTVFMQIGKDIIQGLINGIDFMLGPLDEIVAGVFNLITGGNDGVNTGTAGATGDATGLLGPSTGSVGGRDMGGLTTSGGVLAGGTVTNIYNFYAPVYMSGVGPEGTYDCAPSPLLSSQPMTPTRWT
jgi:hypothetical protein